MCHRNTLQDSTILQMVFVNIEPQYSPGWFFCLLAFQAVLRDALQHSRRALEPGGGSRREVHRAGVHLRPELTAPEPDGCGRPNHAEYEAAEAEGDHL